MVSLTRSVLFCLVLLGWTAAAAADGIVVEHPWSRASAAATGAIFLSISNSGGADRLIGASSPAAAEVQLHVSEADGDIMRMRRVDGVDIPAHGAVVFQPGGYHLMLIGLKEPLKAGTTVAVTLDFAKAGKIAVTAAVEKPGAPHGGSH
ncbi:MAG TPA: copper chaperone PCu(A)C [Rhodospirillaceae bacterium]|nr:copper chaperone PCu(A)C [Rhodospirillaceae bacterium]